MVAKPKVGEELLGEELFHFLGGLQLDDYLVFYD